MPKLVIDDTEIEVEPGIKVIEAAARLGIIIPRFCYHPALGSVGACRVCAVMFLEGPFKGVQMSCMIEAQDGMIVSTTDKEAVDFRKHVIEWLMINHPHDCPVCDEGGHCLLQDTTISGGHGNRRYLGNKRTYPDQNLGPLIQHEMNRCIHCYRCSRFYQEFTGYHDLGVLGIGNHTYYGRFNEGTLESPFTGNLSDLCPTGVYTDKPSRYFGRRWDYQRSASICINCSLGCHTTVSIRYRQVKRQEARFNEAVNGYFICDRGRYGFFYASHQSRPRQARLNGEEVSFAQAMDAAERRLGEFDPSVIAVAGSLRSTLETQAALKHLCQVKGWKGPVLFAEPKTQHSVQTAVKRLEPHLAISLKEVEESDFIIVVGADPLNEAPMLAMAMRQAQRKGARIVLLDPRPISLPFDFLHLPVPPDKLGVYLGSFIKSAVDPETANDLEKKAAEFYHNVPADIVTDIRSELVSPAIHGLRSSRRPVVVCGTDIVPTPLPAQAADVALFLQAVGKKAGLFYVLPGANAFGAGLLSTGGQSFTELIEDIENGTVKALIVAESDPFWYFPDRYRLARAIDSLDLLLVVDYIGSEAARRAHIFVPASSLYEAGGIFINQEGRVQAGPQAFLGGIPISETGAGDHPPRQYGARIPGSEDLPAWSVLADLAVADSQGSQPLGRTDIWKWLVAFLPEFENLNSFQQIPEEGVRFNLRTNTSQHFAAKWSSQAENKIERENNLELILVEWTFGTEELSALSSCLHELEWEPCMYMHRRDAGDLNLRDGDRVAIHIDNLSLEIHLQVVENMAPGLLIVPRHRQLNWQVFGPGKILIGRNWIQKAT